MKEIIWLASLGACIGLMISRKRRVAEGQVSSDRLSTGEKVVTAILAFLNPIVAGAILYFGWRKKLPVKATQANIISWIAFFIQVGFVILLVTMATRRNLFTDIALDNVTRVDQRLTREPLLANQPHQGESGGVKDGWTPLQWTASVSKDKEMVETLLKHGALIDAKDSQGHTALEMAAANGNFEMADALLSHGASVSSKDNEGNTALHASAFQGSGAIAKLLMDHGADINAKDNEGNTALRIAQINEHAEVANVLQGRRPREGFIKKL